MSKRNSQAAKMAARERLRQERERQAKRDKVRRQLIVAGSVVAVLAAAGGIGYAVVQANKPAHWESVKDDKLVKPAHASGKDGTTILVGKSSAKKTLVMYEDPRCPVCASFEQVVGPTVKKGLDAGKFKIQFVGATFLDKGFGGEGSKNALSALGAALNVSPEAFLEYKTALYAKKWHPDERDDKFKDDSYLIEIADTVPALKGNAKFQKDVKDGTFDRWALEEAKVFDKDGVDATPTLKMDGKALTGADGRTAPMSVEEFDTALEAALKG
ncbi:thioredoxin domain-containing protein [Streptomyces achromogenes]|jgi:protein-disulfide isomerase|uniref:DsbA family protein n=1 Tax=Streptomyces achromogenes TaxID=67255 RepID=A0ABZ1KJI3_STRAH|nr:thioredoxin domain-containing protein [Streptomyces achromogenes]MCZ0205534.1 thioredoxin domain-containing protein [Streptomyces sp. UMAF16]